MKTKMTVLTMFLLAAIAVPARAQTTTTCQAISLRPGLGQEVTLTLSGTGPVEALTSIRLGVVKNDGSEGRIAGLKAKILKTALLHESVKQNSGFDPRQYRVKVFGVQVLLSADEAIGVVTDDVLIPMKSVVTYTICHQRTEL